MLGNSVLNRYKPRESGKFYFPSESSGRLLSGGFSSELQKTEFLLLETRLVSVWEKLVASMLTSQE